MRDYSKVSPLFWTGETGRSMRVAGPEVQVVAMYLLTCPSATMTGVYYLPIPTLCHETGSPFEGASKGLRWASEGGFAYYDDPSETVWVPEMARFQIGDSLEPSDKRIKGLIKEIEQYAKTPFYLRFYERYGSIYHLGEPRFKEAPSKPLPRTFEAPSKPVAVAVAVAVAGSVTGSEKKDLSADAGGPPSSKKSEKQRKPSAQQAFIAKLEARRSEKLPDALPAPVSPQQANARLGADSTLGKELEKRGHDAFLKAFDAFLADPYWKGQGCPVGAFLSDKQWPKYLQQVKTAGRGNSGAQEEILIRTPEEGLALYAADLDDASFGPPYKRPEVGHA